MKLAYFFYNREWISSLSRRMVGRKWIRTNNSTIQYKKLVEFSLQRNSTRFLYFLVYFRNKKKKVLNCTTNIASYLLTLLDYD